MQVYVLTAYRWGSIENHSYVCGVFESKEDAQLAANREMLWRGGKYDCMIAEMEMNYPYVAQNNKAHEREWVSYEYSEELEKLNQIEADHARDLSHTF